MKSTSDHIGVGTGRDGAIAASDANAHAVRQAFGHVVFRAAVSVHRQHLEADFHPAAVTPGIAGREIAQDTAPDLAAFRLHADGLGHEQVAVGLHLHVADELQDAFDGGCRHRRRRQHRGNNDGAKRRVHDAALSKLTVGVARPASSASKNSASVKPSGRAISTFGKDWIMMFRLRTAPL
jgi:hypothetical protein